MMVTSCGCGDPKRCRCNNLGAHQVWRKRTPAMGDGRAVGVEIEFVRNSMSHRDWRDTLDSVGGNITSDGSLPSHGAELVSPPMAGDYIGEWVRKVCDEARRIGGRVSRACGLHVHVNSCDLCDRDVWRVLRVWSMVERCFFDASPSSRRGEQGQRYCKPISRQIRLWSDICGGSDPRLWLRGKLYGTYPISSKGGDKTSWLAWERNKGCKYSHARYASLNIHSHYYRGTIECRVGGGSLDWKKITNWAEIVRDTIQWAVSARESTVSSMMSDSLVFHSAAVAAVPDSYRPGLHPWVALKGILSPKQYQWIGQRKRKFSG